MQPFNWVCPYCDRAQTVIENQIDQGHRHLAAGKLAAGGVGLNSVAIACVNPECEQLTLLVTVSADVLKDYGWVRDAAAVPTFSRRLLPDGGGRPQPDYIPQALRDDYSEACLIAELSPKAAATLARRCFQGMIRDFCGISRPRLIDEIRALRTAVDDGTAPRAVSIESVAAIDHVREIGNIGAHMERDIDQIVEVDPGEAKALIQLIELLFREWYVDRHTRQERLALVARIGHEKQLQRAEPRPLLTAD